MSLLDRPTAMASWEQEAVQDLDCVYQSKTIPDRGDIDAVWQSMYEKGLGRKVSQYSLPPQAASELKADSLESGPPPHEISVEQKVEKTEKKPKDLATVHLERALNLGKVGKDDLDGRRWRKRTYSNSSTGEPGHVEHHERKHF